MSTLTDILRRVDRRLHIDHRGRSEWIWLVPAVTFLVVLGVVVLVGYTSRVPAALYAPIAVIIALAITSISVGYMTPDNDYAGGDGGSGEADQQPAPHAPSPQRVPAQRVPAWYGRLHEPGADERVPQRPRAEGKHPST